MAINPAMEGYFSVKNAGKHGEVKLANALGNNYSQPKTIITPIWGIEYMNKGSGDDDSCAEMLD